MRMLALKCEFCGAPLDLPANTLQAQCLYCDNQILIERGGSPSAAPLRKSPIAGTANSNAKTEIAQLDHEWEAYRATYLTRDERGEYDIPVEEHCRMGMWATLILGAIAILLGYLFGFPSSFATAFTLIVIGCIVVTMVQLQRQMKVARIYVRSKRNYEQERLRLLKKLPSSGLD